MFNLKTIETECGIESNKRLRSFQLRLHRGPEARFEVPIEIPRESAQAAVDSPAAAEVWARTPPTFKLERILVPFDFSAASVRLLSWTIAMAERIGARVSVIHVVRPWVPPAGREAPYQFDANGERIETATSLLHRLLDKTCQRVGALHVHVVIGRPVDGIIQFARCMNSDLIVMAAHGERGLKPLFLSATPISIELPSKPSNSGFMSNSPAGIALVDAGATPEPTNLLVARCAEMFGVLYRFLGSCSVPSSLGPP